MGMTSWSFSILVYHEICWSTSTTVMYGSLQYDINNKDLESGVEYVFFSTGGHRRPGGAKIKYFWFERGLGPIGISTLGRFAPVQW